MSIRKFGTIQMKTLSTMAATLVLVCVCSTVQGGAMISNGDFGTSGAPPTVFADWETDTSFSFVSPTDMGGIALFVESLDGVQLSQLFDLPANALRLSFEYQLMTSGVYDGTSVRDSFQATLFNNTFDVLFPSDPSDPVSFPAFFSVDNDGAEFFDSNTPSVPFVSVVSIGGDWRKVTLDLSSLPATTGLTIDFLLSGNPDGIETSVKLDNVVLTVASINPAPVPEPSSAVCYLTLLAIGMNLRRGRRLPTVWKTSSQPLAA